MKKKLLCILLTASMVLGSAIIFASCDGEPKTPEEYAQKALEVLPDTYSTETVVDGWVKMYDKWNDRDWTKQITHKEAKSLVKKTNGGTVTSIAVTEYEIDTESSSVLKGDIKEKNYFEFTNSKDNKYNKTEYLSNKRLFKSTVINDKDSFISEGFKVFNAEAFLEYIADSKNSGGNIPKNVEEFTEQHKCQESPRAKYRVYCGTVSAYLTNDYKLLNIRYSFTDEIESRATITVKSDAQELFDKNSFYATESESAKAIMQGVIDNLPTRYKVEEKISVTASDGQTATRKDYMAYEKRGEIEYFYLGTTADDYYLAETYEKSGNGHIGKVYSVGTKTYTVNSCASDLCVLTENVTENGHTYKNSGGHSFTHFAYMKDAASIFDVNFDLNDVCTLTLTADIDGVDSTYTYVIEGTTLKQIVTTSVSSQGKLVVTFTFDYDGEEVIYDVSDYTQVQ